jgi:hypothetical protein
VILASAVRDLHYGVAFVIVFSNAAVGAWSLAAHRLPRFRRRELWWCVAAAQVLVFVQAAIGVTIQSVEDLEPPDFHYLYGFTMMTVIAMLYGYRIQMVEKRYLLYGGGSLFLMGLGIRAMIIG